MSCKYHRRQVQNIPGMGWMVLGADQTKKSLKQPYHARLVPIHKRLIELGILDYHRSLKTAKQKRLFPDLPYVSNNNRFGDKLQRWFNRTYRNECGISTPNTSFHSLRHTVITHLVNDKGVDPNKIAIGLGQTPVGGVTQTVYVCADLKLTTCAD